VALVPPPPLPGELLTSPPSSTFRTWSRWQGVLFFLLLFTAVLSPFLSYSLAENELIQKKHAAVVHAVALSVVQYDSQNDAPLTDLFYSLEVVCNAIYQELQDCIPYGTSIPVPARQAQRKGRYTNKARALTKRREQRLERNKLIQRTCSFTNSTSNIGLSSYWLSVQSAEPKRGKPQYYRMVGGIIVTGRSSVLACYKGLYWYSMRWQAIPYGQMLANARKCSELLGAAPSCSELLRAAPSSSWSGRVFTSR
jgi:hypothetical protein